jgi:hypothetical protein
MKKSTNGKSKIRLKCNFLVAKPCALNSRRPKNKKIITIKLYEIDVHET